MSNGSLSVSQIILPHLSGSGTTTLNPPTGNNNYIHQLPNVSGTLMIGTPPQGSIVGTTDEQTLTNKTLINPYFNSCRISTVVGLPPGFLCRAWVLFNGTGTVAIIGGGNISSIVDIGTGHYTINFITSMPDDKYGVIMGSSRTNSNTTTDGFIKYYNATASSVSIRTMDTGSTAADHEFISVAIFR